MRNSSDDNLPQQETQQKTEQQQQQHVALPPPDASVRELEELLAQAKVGTHEFSYVPSSPQRHQHRTEHHENQELRPENIPLPLSDDGDESSTERENVVDLEDCASTSSEGSGVLVDPPIALNATTEKAAEQESAATQDLVVVVEKEALVAQSNTTLAVFRTPKLHFFTDEKTIPVQLQQVQQQSCRKRHEFQTRIHDLECKVAQLTAKLAEESMDLDLDLRNAMEMGIYKPLEAAYETISFERYAHRSSSTSSLTQNWMTLERRLSALDSQMTHSVHVQLQDLKRNHLTSLREELDQDVLPELKEENIAADKCETAIARRWESQVGTMARRFEEERATRVAALTVADSALRELEDPRNRRGAELLSHVAALRRQLEHERAERIAQDELIRSYIVERVESMKQAILEAHPDPDTY